MNHNPRYTDTSPNLTALLGVFMFWICSLPVGWLLIAVFSPRTSGPPQPPTGLQSALWWAVAGWPLILAVGLAPYIIIKKRTTPDGL